MIKIAYKIKAETDDKGPIGWPSEAVEFDSVNEAEYVSNGWTVGFIFDFEAYKESMQDEYDEWLEEYHPAPKIVRVNRLTKSKLNAYDVPIDIDFVSGLNVKLHRKVYLVKGECTKEEFYLNFDGTTYSDIVVKEETTFERNALGFPIYKDVVVSWAHDDGTFSPKTKQWRKYYSQLEQIKEGKDRRGNLIGSIQTPCLGLISLAMNGTTTPTMPVILEGRRFLADYAKEFQVFIEDSNKDILGCLNDAEHARYIHAENYTWIDYVIPNAGGMTIRQYITAELTI